MLSGHHVHRAASPMSGDLPGSAAVVRLAATGDDQLRKRLRAVDFTLRYEVRSINFLGQTQAGSNAV